MPGDIDVVSRINRKQIPHNKHYRLYVDGGLYTSSEASYGFICYLEEHEINRAYNLWDQRRKIEFGEYLQECIDKRKQLCLRDD